MKKIKQVIVIRKDLKMRRGKECAQSAHASMAFLSRRIQELCDGRRMPNDFQKYGDFDLWGFLDISLPAQEWLKDSFAKVVCVINSEEELLAIYDKAKNVGLECHLITDSGRTEFNGVPTNTCLAIGPDYEDKIDDVTGGLTLY